MKPPLASWRLPQVKGRAVGVLLAASLLLPRGMATAQDALRYSLAGDAAAEAQRQALGSQPYTYKAGDFKLLVVPSLELDYSDNVTLMKTNAQSDFILKPLVRLTGSYPISQQNMLSFSAGVGYDEYLEHRQYSQVRVDSTSQLLFDMRVKDFLIDFHDRFSFFEDPSAEPGVAGTAEFGGLLNAAGLSGTWDLEDVLLTLNYDHQNFLASASQFDYLNRASEMPLARAGFKFLPQLTAGLEGAAAFTAYDEKILNNNQGYSMGLYADWRPSSFLSVEPRAGYAIYQFQHTSQSDQIYEVGPSGTPIIAPAGASIQTQNQNTWYASIDVTNQITRAVSYTISAGHEIRLGIQADLVEDSYVRPTINWMIIKDLAMQTALYYEHGNQGEGNINGNLAETYDWYGGGLTLSYPLMKKLVLTLSYRFTQRSSDISYRAYTQNVVGLQLSYQPQ